MSLEIEYARAEADRLGSPEVGPLHLLLGVLLNQNHLGGWLLGTMGITPEAVRARIPAGRHAGECPFSPDAQRALDLARARAEGGFDWEDLVPALLWGQEDITLLLLAVGTNPHLVRERLVSWVVDNEQKDREPEPC